MENRRPISLTLHKNTCVKKERRRVWGDLQSSCKTTPKELDGYALVTYSMDEKKGIVVTAACYSVRNPLDAAGLPSLAFCELSRVYLKDRV